MGRRVSDLNAFHWHVLDLLPSPVFQVLVADFQIVPSIPIQVDELDIAICIEKNTVLRILSRKSPTTSPLACGEVKPLSICPRAFDGSG
jgi:hypothetical protein